MRAVLQRVTSAHVEVDGQTVGAIGPGLMVLLGVERGDTETDLSWLVDKTAGLRVFGDDDGKMNRSLQEMGGAVLAVSQFTLLADCSKGRRPGFSAAAPPDEAARLYAAYTDALRIRGITVATGIFQADMAVHLVNDGPVTLLLDSRRRS
jgi:D-tyrosyl-tRNA(Tyr) deacylase